MRFSLAWADVAAKNVTLKIALTSTSIVCVILAVALVKVSLQPPLVIDRGGVSRAISPSSNEHTQTEIEAFLREAVTQRFNSDFTGPTLFLSDDEVIFRKQEQKELSSKSMRQTVVVNSIKIQNQNAEIDSDRLIAVGNIRSALPLPLRVTIANSQRSDANPYGLVLVKIAQNGKETSQ